MTALIRGGVALFGTYFFKRPFKNGREVLKPEELLGVRCADFLRLAAPADLFFCHIPNEGQRSALGNWVQEALGRQKGMTDLHLLFRGEAYYVELKTKRNRPTSEQLEVARRIVAAGGRAAVCYSFEDFTGQMLAWGIVA